MRTRPIAAVVFGVAICAACGSHEAAERIKALEDAATERQGMLSFPTGVRRIDRNLAFLKQAESSGLITMREIPQSYWDSFLGQTQGLGTPYEIRPTQKLLSVAVRTPDSAQQRESSVELVVKVREASLGEVVRDEEYAGPLASPGENCRIILGFVKMVPTPAARILGAAVAHQQEVTLRFRGVVKHSDFVKKWTVVAMDFGPPNSEEWYSSDVK